jgi:hypothetical protein
MTAGGTTHWLTSTFVAHSFRFAAKEHGYKAKPNFPHPPANRRRQRPCDRLKSNPRAKTKVKAANYFRAVVCVECGLGGFKPKFAFDLSKRHPPAIR